LQFLQQQLDIITFNLALEWVCFQRVYGSLLTTKKYFRTEFNRSTPKKKIRWLGIFLKAVYFINLGAMLLGAMIQVK